MGEGESEMKKRARGWTEKVTENKKKLQVKKNLESFNLVGMFCECKSKEQLL